jgi:lysophospholipase L1-like esterase
VRLDSTRCALGVALVGATFILAVSACSDDGSSPANAAKDGGDTTPTNDGSTADSEAPKADAGDTLDGDASSAPLETMHVVGRVDRRDPAGIRFSWAGIEIHAKFSGTGATLRLHEYGEDELDIVIDNGPPSLLKPTPAIDVYPIASGLPDAVHDVVIRKRTEALVGTIQFFEITSTEGRPLVAFATPVTRRIEFVGDSITSGYGVLGTTATCPFTPSTEDEGRAWGNLTAKALGAEHTAISYSGIGIFRSYDGETTEQMPVRYERALTYDATSLWDFTTWIPDAVVVNLGTNDFAKGDPGASYTSALTTFFATVRQKYPNAEIVAADSPMLSNDFPAGAQARTKAIGYIDAAINARVGAGDTKISHVAIDEQLASDGYGCDYHPNQTTQQKMSAKLVAHLEARLGW